MKTHKGLVCLCQPLGSPGGSGVLGVVRKKGRASVLHGTTAPPLAADDQPLQLMAFIKHLFFQPFEEGKKIVLKPALRR